MSMYSVIFQFSKSKRLVNSVSIFHLCKVVPNATKGQRSLTSPCAKIGEEMGKTKNKPRKSSPSPSPSISRVHRDIQNNQMNKYRDFLMRNEGRFSKDVECLTQKKKPSQVSDPSLDENGILTFRPKIVVDYRHCSKSSSSLNDDRQSKKSSNHDEDEVQVIGERRGEKDQTIQRSFVIRDISRETSSSRGAVTGGHDEGFQFTVLSYNILADNLMKAHPALYTRSRREDLDWKVRWAGIKAELKAMDWPDIVCLQEVQFRNPDHALEFIVPFLGQHGYKTVVKPKTGRKDDGCITAFKKDKFMMEESCPVDYKVDRVPVLDRDNVGLLLKLTPLTETSSPLIIANTHLLYNPKRGDIRLCQTAMLLAEIDRLRSGSSTPVILTGDLNSEPSSPVLQLLTSGDISYAGVKLGRRAKRPAPPKLLPDSLGLSDSCQWQVALQQRAQEDGFSVGSGRFWHKLDLAPVFRDPEAVTTYQEGWITVDHMLYSRSRGLGQLELTGRCELPRAGDMSGAGRIPSCRFPSDHLPLLAKFKLSSKSNIEC